MRNNTSENEHPLHNRDKALQLLNKWKSLPDKGFRMSKKKLHIRDTFGWTPLYYALLNGRTKVVKVVLNNDAGPNATDLAEWTPLHYAMRLDDEECSEWALKTFIWALLRRGANIEIYGKDGTRAFHYAARRARETATKMLLEARANMSSIILAKLHYIGLHMREVDR